MFSDFLPSEVHKHLRAERIALLILVLWHSFNSRWILNLGIKSYLGPTEIASFSCRDLCRRNKHDLFWLVVSAIYLYIVFLRAIVVSDFLPLEIDQHLRAESTFVLWHCFNSRCVVDCGIKFFSMPAEIASYSCRNLSQRNKHDLFCLGVSASYLYILFL